MYVYIHAYMQTHACVDMYIYIYIYTHRNGYTYIGAHIRLLVYLDAHTSETTLRTKSEHVWVVYKCINQLAIKDFPRDTEVQPGRDPVYLLVCMYTECSRTLRICTYIYIYRCIYIHTNGYAYISTAPLPRRPYKRHNSSHEIGVYSIVKSFPLPQHVVVEPT
jgi:hypothetical protein